MFSNAIIALVLMKIFNEESLSCKTDESMETDDIIISNKVTSDKVKNLVEIRGFTSFLMAIFNHFMNIKVCSRQRERREDVAQ